jgi:hypothetical protein
MHRCRPAATLVNHSLHLVLTVAGAKQLERALDIVEQHSVPLTEELADRLAPAPSTEPARQASLVSLQRVAKLCRKQGLFHLAAKKYMQVWCVCSCGVPVVWG